ncbi:hypothetical protein VSS93_33050, partial [Pseudomonas syringae pv. tagetis]
ARAVLPLIEGGGARTAGFGARRRTLGRAASSLAADGVVSGVGLVAVPLVADAGAGLLGSGELGGLHGVGLVEYLGW